MLTWQKGSKEINCAVLKTLQNPPVVNATKEMVFFQKSLFKFVPWLYTDVCLQKLGMMYLLKPNVRTQAVANFGVDTGNVSTWQTIPTLNWKRVTTLTMTTAPLAMTEASVSHLIQPQSAVVASRKNFAWMRAALHKEECVWTFWEPT